MRSMGKGIKTQRKETLSVAIKYEAFYTGGLVQFTKEGQLMICMCTDQLKLVDVSSGKIQQSIDGNEGEEISSFILADDDSTLVVAMKNGLLKQWNLKEKKLIRTWKSFHVGKVSYMAFDPSVTLLATGGSDGTIKIWDIRRKYCTHNLKGAQGVFSVVCFQYINSRLYVFGAADDYNIRVWDLETSSCISVLESHSSTVTAILFIVEQDKMISSSRDKVIIIWDIETCIKNGKPLKIVPVFEAIESLIEAPEELKRSLLPEYKESDVYVITAGEKGILRIWECSSAKCVYSQGNSVIAPPQDSDHTGPVITQAIYIPSIDSVCVISFEQNIVLYSIKDFSLLKQFVGYNDDILDLKFMGENEQFLAVATNSPHIKIFESSTFNCQLLKGHLDIVVALDVFPSNPNMLISGSKDNSLKVWKLNPDSGIVDCVFLCYGHTLSVNAVACSRNKSLFFMSGSEDTTLKLWKIPKKIPLVALKLTLSANSTVKAHDKNINSIAISCNDKYIATGSQDSTAKIWDTTDLSLIGTMRGHKKGVWCVTFSPIDLVLATSSNDGTIKIWSLSDFTPLKTFDGHEAPVLKVFFLTRGTQLISSASDGLLKLWDIKDTECVGTFDGHSKKIWALAVSSDENVIVSGAADSNIVVWRDVTKEENEKTLAEEEKLILQKQDLSNLIHEKRWPKALCLSILLAQPFQALNIINEILLEKNGKITLKETIDELTPDQIDVLLQFVVDWNTNSRRSHAAQCVLNIILMSYTPTELLKNEANVTAVEALLPYTERHYNRLQSFLQDSSGILEFICQNMTTTCEDD